jgi:uncharacterized repeat protein (TIGR03837 family)
LAAACPTRWNKPWPGLTSTGLDQSGIPVGRRLGGRLPRHGLAHPRLPLTKHFFFPGFTDHTGGLLCEDGLIETRQQWQQDSLAQRAFWQMFDIPEKQPEEWRVSLFAYENPAARELLAYWTESPMPVHCMVPEGKVLADVEAVMGQPLQAGQHVSRGALTVHVLPMTDQDSYDLTLWSCDINFVRGEDSFVRAQWAGRPFIWHIYPQEDAAHMVKLDAFLSHYCRGIDAETARPYRQPAMPGTMARAWCRLATTGKASAAVAPAQSPLAGQTAATRRLGDAAGAIHTKPAKIARFSETVFRVQSRVWDFTRNENRTRTPRWQRIHGRQRPDGRAKSRIQQIRP